MLLQDALSEMLLAKDYTPYSLRRRREGFKDFLAWCASQGITDVESFTRQLARRYVAYVREKKNRRTGKKLSSETQHTQAAYVKTFLRFCVDEGWLDADVVRRFEMPKQEKRVIQVFTRKHYDLLMKATDDAFLASLHYRDKALLSLMIDTGLRGTEVCSLTFDGVFISPHESYIRVDGKGRRQREVGLGKDARLALHRYITRARPKSDLSYVFLSRDGKQLTTNAIDRTLTRLKRVAGPQHFTGIRVSAHTLRHSFAVHYMQQGGDVYKLSRLLGHENITTTERYLRAYQARDSRLTSKSVLDNL